MYALGGVLVDKSSALEIGESLSKSKWNDQR